MGHIIAEMFCPLDIRPLETRTYGLSSLHQHGGRDSNRRPPARLDSRRSSAELPPYSPPTIIPSRAHQDILAVHGRHPRVMIAFAASRARVKNFPNFLPVSPVGSITLLRPVFASYVDGMRITIRSIRSMIAEATRAHLLREADGDSFDIALTLAPPHVLDLFQRLCDALERTGEFGECIVGHEIAPSVLTGLQDLYGLGAAQSYELVAAAREEGYTPGSRIPNGAIEVATRILDASPSVEWGDGYSYTVVAWNPMVGVIEGEVEGHYGEVMTEEQIEAMIIDPAALLEFMNAAPEDDE